MKQMACHRSDATRGNGNNMNRNCRWWKPTAPTTRFPQNQCLPLGNRQLHWAPGIIGEDRGYHELVCFLNYEGIDEDILRGEVAKTLALLPAQVGTAGDFMIWLDTVFGNRFSS